jgi:hypothetical protein
VAPTAAAFDTLPPGTADPTGTESAASVAEPFTVTAVWGEDGTIDSRFTCDGDNISPEVSWTGVPEGTVEIALVLVDDSVVTNGQSFVHWAVAGIDPAEPVVAEGSPPEGSIQALNFFGDIGYGGPCPPPGEEPHQYRLTAYALNTRLERADGSLATDVLDDIARITVRSSDLRGTYGR